MCMHVCNHVSQYLHSIFVQCLLRCYQSWAGIWQSDISKEVYLKYSYWNRVTHFRVGCGGKNHCIYKCMCVCPCVCVCTRKHSDGWISLLFTPTCFSNLVAVGCISDQFSVIQMKHCPRAVVALLNFPAEDSRHVPRLCAEESTCQ